MLSSLGVNVSPLTVSRRLTDDFKLPSKKPAGKPRVTSEIKNKRLTFTIYHKDWTEEQWGHLPFLDESQVQQF